MNAVEKALAKAEYTKKRTQYTDGLRMKRLCDNNVDYEPESFSGCLALVLQPMSEVQQGRLEANHTFPDREILAMHVAEEANLRGWRGWFQIDENGAFAKRLFRTWQGASGNAMLQEKLKAKYLRLKLDENKGNHIFSTVQKIVFVMEARKKYNHCLVQA